jgi:adenylate kinase family enzyme
MARRIAVVGVSGNGKTTFARRLAVKLDLPYTELDALHHLPGWVEASEVDFRREVEAVMNRSEGWVLDGSYMGKLGDLILRRADTIVWLDQPLPLVLRRLVTRG